MPRAGYTHVLSTPFADAYQRVASGGVEQTITLSRDCNALILSAETATVFCTFDDTAASATNGLPIVVAQPVYLPIGRVAHSAGKLRFFSATGIIHILQIS